MYSIGIMNNNSYMESENDFPEDWEIRETVNNLDEQPIKPFQEEATTNINTNSQKDNSENNEPSNTNEPVNVIKNNNSAWQVIILFAILLFAVHYIFPNNSIWPRAQISDGHQIAIQQVVASENPGSNGSQLQEIDCNTMVKNTGVSESDASWASLMVVCQTYKIRGSTGINVPSYPSSSYLNSTNPTGISTVNNELYTNPTYSYPKTTYTAPSYKLPTKSNISCDTYQQPSLGSPISRTNCTNTSYTGAGDTYISCDTYQKPSLGSPISRTNCTNTSYTGAGDTYISCDTYQKPSLGSPISRTECTNG